MTTSADGFAGVASSTASPAKAWSHRIASAATGGSSSGPILGSPAALDSTAATKAGQSTFSHSSASLRDLSASVGSVAAHVTEPDRDEGSTALQ